MLNPLRLFRRREHIDDAAMAYIEGRSAAADEAWLSERVRKEPGLRGDLDSLRQTVTLLRSVERAQAPRSFALSHVPARAARRRSQRLALAPAVLAIVAAAGVGLLAVGNIADVVRQSDSAGARTALQMESAADDGAGGAPGSSFTATESNRQPMSGSDAAAATAVPYGTPEPPPEPAGDAGEAAIALAPPTSDGGQQPTATGGGGADAEMAESGMTGIAPELSLPLAADSGEVEGVSKSSIPGAAGGADAPTAVGDGGGFAMPLWQVELALGLFAAAMLALWLLQRRRAVRG